MATLWHGYVFEELPPQGWFKSCLKNFLALTVESPKSLTFISAGQWTPLSFCTMVGTIEPTIVQLGSNSWRILNHFQVKESDPSDPHLSLLKEEIRSQYRCWWLRHLTNPDNSPKLRTFCLFKTSFGTSPYLDT